MKCTVVKVGRSISNTKIPYTLNPFKLSATGFELTTLRRPTVTCAVPLGGTGRQSIEVSSGDERRNTCLIILVPGQPALNAFTRIAAIQRPVTATQ